PRYQYHREKSRITEFAGFEMPLWYTSISEECIAVRNRLGIFDVSHMGRILLNGPDSDEFLDHMIPTRAALQPPGKSFYTLLLNERGGIEDDLIVLKNAANDYLLVVNAVNTSKDLEHVTRRARESHGGGAGTKAQSTTTGIQGRDAEGAHSRGWLLPRVGGRPRVPALHDRGPPLSTLEDGVHGGGRVRDDHSRLRGRDAPFRPQDLERSGGESYALRTRSQRFPENR